MAAVTIAAGDKVAYYSSGSLGWSARSLFAYRTAIQQIVGATNLTFGSASASTARAQSFTTGTSVTLTEVRLVLGKTATPTDNISLEIRADSGSSTVSATVIATATNLYNGASISTTASWVSFQFATPVSLSASTKYWIVMQRSGAVDAVNFYNTRSNTGSAYAGGGLATLNAGVWSAESASNDLAFQIIQQTPIALYAVTQDTSLHVLKSTDTGATWTAQDDSNAPTVTNANYPFDATETITGPYLTTAYLTATNTAAVKQFDMSSDTWTAGTWGTIPPSAVSNERSIRVSHGNTYQSPAPFSTILTFTDSADDADIAYQRATTSAGAWGAKTSVLAATSTEASLVSEALTDKAAGGFTHQFYYDCVNDDFSMRSLTSTTLGTETDLSAAAADVETEHASAVYQIYQNGSGVDTIIAAFIDAAGTLQERILNLEVTSASVTMAADNAVDSATTTAGRQLSTARYDGTNYIAVNVSGSGISYYTSTVAGTWSSATSFVSGLTNCTLSRIYSIEGVGLAVIYTDNGDTKIDWIAVAGGGNTNVNGSTATVTADANAGAVSIPRTIAGTTATATGAASTGTLPRAIAGLTGTAIGAANAGTFARDIPGVTATATGAANTGSITAPANPAGTTATAIGDANAGTRAWSLPGLTAAVTSTANAGTPDTGAVPVTVNGVTAAITSAASTGTFTRSIPGLSALVTVASNAGSLTYTASPTGTTAAATSTANAGTLTYGANISGATAAAIGSANAGSLSYARSVSGVTASATTAANAGTVQAGTTVSGTTATATSAANAGSLTYGANVTGTTATATGTANAGSPNVPRNIIGTTASVTAAANAGTRTYGANITGTTATATGTANAGTPVSGSNVSGTTATVTSAASAGSLSYAATVNGTTATVSANANAGSLTYGANVSGTRAIVTSAANAGTISVGKTISGITATVTSSANAGTANAPANIAGQTAAISIAANAASRAITVNGATATAGAVAIAGAVFTGSAATVSGVTATIVIDASAGTISQVVIAGRLIATLSHRPALFVTLARADALRATLSHDARLSASIDHDTAAGATIEHSGVLSARLEKV